MVFFVWVRRVLNGLKRRFLARADLLETAPSEITVGMLATAAGLPAATVAAWFVARRGGRRMFVGSYDEAAAAADVADGADRGEGGGGHGGWLKSMRQGLFGQR